MDQTIHVGLAQVTVDSQISGFLSSLSLGGSFQQHAAFFDQDDNGIFIHEIITPKIPPGYASYMNGKLPKKVFLRDVVGNLWPIGLTKSGKDIYFQCGWKKFIKENILEFGDFLVFDYDDKETFNFRLFGKNGCEKKEIGGLKLVVKEEVTEEMIVERQTSADPKGKTLACDSGSGSSDDDSHEDYGEDEEYEEINFKVSRSKSKRPDTFNKKAPRLKAGCKRAAACKVSNFHDRFGAGIFKSGRVTQPKNPYFVETIRSNRKSKLYVPVDVVRDFKLELPPSMMICDSAGRKVETKVHRWADGRIWLIDGWGSLCRMNFVENNDKCICEFVRGEGDKGLHLQVQFLHEGESSHPNKKTKK